MPRRARIHLLSLRSSLVNLPISIYGPLLERNIASPSFSLRPSAVNRVDAYVGWTGMLSASSLAHFNAVDRTENLETVEIDPQYAQGLGLSQGDIVEIGLLHDLPTAKSVATEPLTADDWEILELHADQVESTLLSQVRVASVGQEIDVWVLGRTRIRLRVVSLDPSDSKALILTTNTEVSIAPKTRRPRLTPVRKATSSSAPPVEIVPPSNSTPSGASKSRTVGLQLRVLPSSLVSVSISQSSELQTIACVSSQTLSALRFEGRLNTDIQVFQGDVQRLLPPPDPSEGPSNADSSAVAPSAQVLHPGAAEAAKNSSQKEKKDQSEVLVCGNESVPQGHVVFVGGTDGVAEWGLVRSVSRVARLFIAADSDASASASITPVLSSTPPPIHTLAGVDDLLTKCQTFCNHMFSLYRAKMLTGLSGLLITGRTGAGKTSIAQATMKALQWDPRTHAFTYYVDLSRYTEKSISAIRSQFQYWLDKAMWHRPTVLVFDNMDKLLSAELEHADSFRTRQLTEIFVSMFSNATHDITPNTTGILILATAQSQSSLHPLLSTKHVFKQTVHLKPPGKDARKQIISQLVKGRLVTASNLVIDEALPLDFVALSTETEGYSATDMQDLVARAVHQAAIRSSKGASGVSLTMGDFQAAQLGFTPLSLRDVPLQKSTVEWADIGGLNETRRALRETLEWPTKYAAIFDQSPLRLRSGLLLYGYPGCGKTLLASAVAKECGLNFITVKGPELLNKYIGASEKSVRDIFERANAAKPCVLFFDEFDSIAPKRGHDSTGVTDRVVNQLLTLMDGAEGLDGVYVLAATSRPDLIDPALLRPGRLDKSLLCNMPTAEERKEILQAHARKVPVSPSVDFDALARATDGFSGADLQALLYNAHLELVHASISTSSGTTSSADASDEPVDYVSLGAVSKTGVKSRAEEVALQRRLKQLLSSPDSPDNQKTAMEPIKHEIHDEHLHRVLKTTRPSVSPDEIKRLRRIYAAFVSDRSGELPIPPDAEAAGVGQRASLM
ncbi:AAA family ATPase, CDC48 subfamily [Heterobasidion irregulare TC 32-1]|uniref:Peroxisomal ATPase PEX1 n=1 Tax=Heterobasidion irregulare (strain TC 32-1) TaxID=747525 RepID=W4JPN5_HETIT|nr:AAA family ATPase, CDC48 subfamily [Heterobasidion irregulare TC 32-1]ETW75050.1 AAA family ATPase, CDC48 subfamily [Heterobasidion irregulare TC 32-1]